MAADRSYDFHLRLRAQLQKQIRIAAAANDRSLNAEIAARLEQSFADDGEDRQRVAQLLTAALAIIDKGGR
ncbi:Arc family DNA-binding protein [Mesorhizobium sp. M0959]|uniref:Arc family DNA-binding protein n=1 Tax=unclassified Mesorhizobium TaxID=325217 RepID=UPI00333DED78